MKQFTNFVGLDISKKTFDAALYDGAKKTTILHEVFEQNEKGYTGFFDWLQGKQAALPDTLFCLEHTGIYIHGLLQFLCKAGASVWVEMPLRIKKSMGLQRGGNDKAAAIGIAQYAYRYQDAAKLYSPAAAALEQLQHLTAQRTRLINSITQLTVPLNELAQCDSSNTAKDLQQLQKQAIAGLEKSVAK